MTLKDWYKLFYIVSKFQKIKVASDLGLKALSKSDCTAQSKSSGE